METLTKDAGIAAWNEGKWPIVAGLLVAVRAKTDDLYVFCVVVFVGAAFAILSRLATEGTPANKLGWASLIAGWAFAIMILVLVALLGIDVPTS